MDLNLTMAQYADVVVNNRALGSVNKGVLLSSAGGILSPEEHGEFMQTVATGSEFFANTNFIPNISRATYNFDHFTWAARQMAVAVPGTDATSGTVTPVRRTLTPTRGVIPLDVSYDWIRDNADGRPAQEVLLQYVADNFRKDVVDLAGNGDGSTPGFLAINSGFPVLAAADSDSDVHTYDATNATMLGASGILALMRNQLPSQYRENVTVLCNTTEADKYVDELGALSTQLGDQTTLSGNSPNWHKSYKVVGLPTWPVDKLIMAPSWNIATGMWSNDLRIDVEDRPRASCVTFVIQASFDFNYVNGDALVYGTTD